ncbi:MAG: enoyl-CoA hydratase [Albidovulum sp.]|nr:enoyl-CoA hydratase [Albidovulum sp.]MDE0305520.1 enoyl-CoA hydratase [Albidovulum sp.]MDE0533423.1 enoyl-CoA hydratase [Albidovulum sp.]
MQQEILKRYDRDGVSTLTLNSPTNLNALSEAMIDALASTLSEIAEDKSVRVLVLQGAGKAFCAGHDLKEMTQGRQAPDGGKAYFKMIFDKCAAMMTAIARLPQPVIAKVHGVAVAAGCQLVATCDMAISSEDARFGVNGVNIGLFCSTPMVALSRNIPRKVAFELLTTGDLIPADRAHELGLVNRVVASSELDRATGEIARKVAGKLGAAVKIGKLAFYEQAQMTVDRAYEYAGSVMVENMLYRDTEEGISAFLEKRPPSWSQ